MILLFVHNKMYTDIFLNLAALLLSSPVVSLT